ncbi:MAG: hypothetical protein A3F73_10395 [Gallionellales bacterium RIFCSPLOWO2_12_FULL_59_22]|nr:MAG: hypothetical protein A3F73_10395 [Gallionellales bacterium RIFCSPLOWO2_12_FULL_59_22]
MTLLSPEDQLPSDHKKFLPYLPLLGFVALAILVAATAYFSFRQLEGALVRGKLNDLGAIADTKVEQIVAWREIQKRTGEGFSQGSLLADEFERWLQEGRPSNARKQRVRQLLSELQYVHGYKILSLLDRQGATMIAGGGDYVPDAEEMRLATQAMDSRKALLTDFHTYDDKSHEVFIDLVVPLITSENQAARVVGAAVLVIDPRTYLYPLIQSWPTRRGSAETLLVRREGNNVLFISDTYHDAGAALSLRLPLDRQDLPAAMATRGEKGTTEGTDYRGVTVVAAMREVPGTPWFMVVKVDKVELLAQIDQIRTWMTGLGLVFAALGGSLFFVWLRAIQERHRLLTVQRDAAIKRAMLVKHFEYLEKYANDIILVSDMTGRIVEANERALQTYGYTSEEMLQLKISDLRLPAEDPAILRGQLEQIGERGELRYETVNRRKDGTTFPIEVSIRAIEAHGAKYLHGIARDITARKQAEDILRKSETMLRESQRMAQIGSWELDLASNVLSWSDEIYRILEVERTLPEVTYETFLNTVHPDDRPMVDRAYIDSVKDRTSYNIVHRLLFPEGRIKYVREWCETHYDGEGRPIRSIGTTQDVTAHETADRKVHRLNNLYAAISLANEAILRIGDRSMLLHEICRIAVEYGQFRLVWIGLLDGTTHTLRSAASCGEAREYLDGADISIAAGKDGEYEPIGMAIRDNREYICNDLLNSQRMSHMRENAEKHGLRAFAVSPLELEGDVVGVLAVYAGEANYFDNELASLLEDLCGDVSLALENFGREDRRRQAGEMLRQSEEKFRTLAASLPQGVFVKDANSVYIACNAIFAKDMMVDPEAIAGKTDYDFFPAGLADKYREDDSRIMSSGQTESYEESYTREGEQRVAYTTKAPFRDGRGKIVGVIAVYWDITERKQAEQQLARQEKFIRQVVDTDPNLISVRDAEGKFLLANRAMATLHGMRPEELAGLNADKLFAGMEQLDAVLRTDREVIDKRDKIEFIEHVLLGGANRWFQVTKVPMEQPDGSVHVLDMAVDITASRLAAENLLKSAQRIEDLYDRAPCGYHSLDKDGIFVNVNNTELEWLGYSRHELVGQRKFIDLLAPSGGVKFFPWFERLMAKGGVQELELDVLRKDGTVLQVQLNATAIYDADGHFAMSRATMTDITARKIAEKALRESENLFRTTVDNAPIIIWVADMNGELDFPGCRFFNQRWREFTGHDPEKVQVCDWVNYIHHDDAGRCLDAYHDAFEQALPFKLEYRLRRHDGEYRWMMDSGVPRFKTEGGLAGFIGTCVDMTEQKQFEKMRAQMEHFGRLNIAGEMASGMAHELSQPLTACSNYLDGCLRRMNEKDWDRERLHRAVQLAHNQAERAGKIINHLKEMVRKQGHERAPVDVNLLVRDTMAFLENEIKQQGVSSFMVLSPLPPVMASKVEIEQVLLNLCKNAIEAMRSAPECKLRVRTRVTEAGEIMVTVSDSGSGIPPSELENLFKPFQTSKQDGLGLGLAICRTFIENHGGRIWAESQPGVGTEFNFTLPVGTDHE